MDDTYMLGASQIFTLFFIMLGPVKLLGPFAQATHGLDDARIRILSFQAFVIASITLCVGGFVGRALLGSWSIQVPVLLLTGGIIFFLVALRMVMHQYDTTPPSPVTEDRSVTAMRIVFPTVITPYGIAALIALLAVSRDAERTLLILGLLLGVMVLNLLTMMFVRPILKVTGIAVLQVLSAVLGVLMVALALEIIVDALQLLKALG